MIRKYRFHRSTNPRSESYDPHIYITTNRLRRTSPSASFAALVAGAGILIPGLALAHVRWFAESVAPARAYQLTDFPVMAAIAICLVAVLTGFALERAVRVPAAVATFARRWTPLALSLTTLGTGAALILFAIQGFLFSPNLAASTPVLIVEALAGLMLLVGFHVRYAGIVIMGLFAYGFAHYGTLPMIEALEIAGLAGRPRLVTGDAPLPFRSMKEYALPVLRVATGLNLIILGFSEKILAPGLAADFLAHHSWNFMAALGFTGFTDYWFAFAAGASEALIGLFLVLGLMTRITTVALAVFLASTLLILGPVELLGHLPHFSIAISLLVIGSGPRLLAARNAARRS